LDHVVPTLLDDPVFTVDGGLTSEEAFEIGPFLQSRMHAKGVQCTDCHDPHSAKLRADGNAVCERCHDAATFDTPAHHKHGPETGVTACPTPSRRRASVSETRVATVTKTTSVSSSGGRTGTRRSRRWWRADAHAIR